MQTKQLYNKSYILIFSWSVYARRCISNDRVGIGQAQSIQKRVFALSEKSQSHHSIHPL